MPTPFTLSRLFLAAFAANFGASTAVLAHSGDKDHEHGNGFPLYLTRTLDASAQDSTSPGNLWVGSGIPATNFMTQVNTDAGVELAIKGMVRQGPDILPTYVDDDGIVHVQVPSGAQPGNPTRAAWNFTYSVNAALANALPSLGDYEATLAIDLDPSDRTDYLYLRLAQVGTAGPGPEPDTNGYGWVAGNTVVIGDDEGTSRVTQNSQNYAFYASLVDSDPSQHGVQPYTFGPAQFDVELSVRLKRGWMRGNQIAHVHVVFDVVDP